MLLIDSTALQIIWAGISGLIGTWFLAIAAEGFLKIDLPVWLRPLTGGLFSDVFQIVATISSGIKSVEDFKGKRIAVGPVGSGGEVDARIIGLALGAADMTELMLDNKVIMVPITDEAVANLRKVNPFYGRRVIPADVYPNQSYPVPTVGTPPDIIIVRAELDEKLAYDMTKALYTNLKTLNPVTSLMKQFGPSLVVPDNEMLIPYHTGARKYFVEQGWLK
jgi:TRAP-type uncharacterized transport system substrate-binding protein